MVEGLDGKPQLVVIRGDERKVVDRNESSDNTSVYESLAYKRTNRQMAPILITIPGGVARETALSHEGEEFLHVVASSVDFEYGNEIVPLQAGDSLYFDANVSHRRINSKKRPARVLCVFSKPSIG